MKITRETDYSIRCMLFLSGDPTKVSMVDEISQAMDIPKSFLAKILQKLKRAQLVDSFLGVRGGFKLAKDPTKINLLDIINAMQGGVGVNICAVDEGACDRSDECVIHPIWNEIQANIQHTLKGYDLASLVKLEKAKSMNIQT